MVAAIILAALLDALDACTIPDPTNPSRLTLTAGRSYLNEGDLLRLTEDDPELNAADTPRGSSAKGTPSGQLRAAMFSQLWKH